MWEIKFKIERKPGSKCNQMTIQGKPNKLPKPVVARLNIKAGVLSQSIFTVSCTVLLIRPSELKTEIKQNTKNNKNIQKKNLKMN